MFEGRFHTPEDAQFGAAWQVLQSPERAQLLVRTRVFFFNLVFGGLYFNNLICFLGYGFLF